MRQRQSAEEPAFAACSGHKNSIVNKYNIAVPQTKMQNKGQTKYQNYQNRK